MNKRFALTLASSLLLAAFSLVHAASPTTQMPSKKPQVAGFYQHQFGDYQITALLDGTIQLPRAVFQGMSDAQVSHILQKYHVDQAKGIQTSVNAFLVNDGKQLSLIDSGAASCFGANLGSIQDNLIASGHKLESVNHVFLTHLHPDHVCGVSKNGVAVYPNAILHISKQEYDYWLDGQTLAALPQAQQEKFLGTVIAIKAALEPYEKAGKIKLFSDKVLQVGGVQIKPSQGHTPGHYSFVLNHQGKQLVFIGDVVHSHTIQFDRPATAVEFDVDPIQAVSTRLKHFAQYAKEGQTIAAPHLPFPGIGHIHLQERQTYQWIPIHFQD